MTTRLSKEDQERLMIWPYVYRIPIFPADTINKEISLIGWNTKDFRYNRLPEGDAQR